MEKMKDPGTIISVGTAMGMVVASFYFFNRFNTMQTEVEDLKKTSKEHSGLISNLNSKIDSFIKISKKNSVEFTNLKREIRSISCSLEDKSSNDRSRGKNINRPRRTNVNEDDEIEEDIRSLDGNFQRAFN